MCGGGGGERIWNGESILYLLEVTYLNTVGFSYQNRGRWMVLIDAAKGCATGPLDLSKYKADFVVISFYKVSTYNPLRWTNSLKMQS